MRSLVFAFLVSCSLPLAVLGCSNGNAVTSQHIALASDKCAANGGLKQVERADATRMSESCGYKCSRYTGQIEYEAQFSCKNGAHFDLTWQE
jgi:hypothetical protein